MKKEKEGFITKIEKDPVEDKLKKLYSLKVFWEWADKMKDQYGFYLAQEQKNIKLKSNDVLKRDSTMFLANYLAILCQVFKSFEEEPLIVLPSEIKEAKDKLGFNLNKFGEAFIFPGRSLTSDRMYMDVLNQPQLAMINLLHVNVGYFIDKKIQELLNRDLYPYMMNKN